jgi:hypothetical protein
MASQEQGEERAAGGGKRSAAARIGGGGAALPDGGRERGAPLLEGIWKEHYCCWPGVGR